MSRMAIRDQTYDFHTESSCWLLSKLPNFLHLLHHYSRRMIVVELEVETGQREITTLSILPLPALQTLPS